jgi:peptide/nickel transport system substrate-binding protein
MWRRILSLALAPLIIAGTSSAAIAATKHPKPSTSAEDALLNLYLPGPLTPCTALDTSESVSSAAILDLVRPSAFLNNPNGFLIGAGGPIVSSELISMAPQTVVYTIAKTATWSDGRKFRGRDFVSWWQRARTLNTQDADGYQDISDVQISNHGRSVTVAFSRPYSDWPTLFRDLEQSGSTFGCSWHDFKSRASLGPYVVAKAVPGEVVLTRNPRWEPNIRRFGEIVIRTPANLGGSSGFTVATTSQVGARQVSQIATSSRFASKFSSSQVIESLRFAPRGFFTSSIDIRRALAWSINRSALINQLWYLVTSIPTPATSVVWSQGSPAYPGGPVSTLTDATATEAAPPTSPGIDCGVCATSALRTAGAKLVGNSWFWHGYRMAIRLGYGPTAIDRTSAIAIARTWRSLGIGVTLVPYTSSVEVASDVAYGTIDAAVFSRATYATASQSARSWYGTSLRDAFFSGAKRVAWQDNASHALTTFNPATSATYWTRLDQGVLRTYFERPLYTLPSWTVWSQQIVGVTSSFLISGLVDQVPNWSLAPASPVG